MSITLIGGMDRMSRHYLREAGKFGIELKIFNQATTGMVEKMRGSDAIVLFTNMVSHQARNAAVTEAKKRDIPIYMYHSCGLCTLRDCFNCLRSEGF